MKSKPKSKKKVNNNKKKSNKNNKKVVKRLYLDLKWNVSNIQKKKNNDLEMNILFSLSN